MQNLGKIIQKLLKKYRLLQTQLANQLDVPSQSKISSWDNGACIPDILEA